MVRNTFAFGIVFSLVAALASAASAGDPVTAKSGFSGGAIGGATMTLAGKGTAESAAKAPDTEQTWYHGYRRGYYRGFYAGVGYPYGYAYPYAVGYPYSVGYYRPYYIPPAVGFYGRFGPVAVGVGINGGVSDLTAPAVSLNLAAPVPQRPAQPAPGAAPQPSGVYDGGPANPVPLPRQDPNGPSGQAVPALPPSSGLPVSLPKTTTIPAKPYTYTYKGYGEK